MKILIHHNDNSKQRYNVINKQIIRRQQYTINDNNYNNFMICNYIDVPACEVVLCPCFTLWYFGDNSPLAQERSTLCRS